MRSLYVCLVLAGCAKGTSGGGGGGDIDASVRRDSTTVPTDSSMTMGTDASMGCTTMTKNMLRNGNYDATPAGVDWVGQPIDAAAPIVTDEAGGVAAKSGTFRAWMGGYEQSSSTNKDSLYQDVTIPAMTTKLEFKGFYDLRTGENPLDTNIYDRATIELVTATNTQLELVKALDDNNPTTTYTSFSKLFTGSYSGQTVRLRFSTTSDIIDATSVFFEDIELNATFCQ